MVKLTRLGQIKSFIRQWWSLAAPFWKGPQRNKTAMLLAVAMVLNIANIYMSVRLNTWSRDFFNAIDNKDINEFFWQLGLLFVLAGVSLTLYANKKYLCSKAALIWRGQMSEYYSKRWLESKCYYYELFFKRIDNPDQRIAEDLRIFSALTIRLVFGFIDSIGSLGAFAVILWNLSEAYAVLNVVIPGLMLWLAIGFVIVGTWLTHLIGQPMVDLKRRSQKCEADYRYSLLRIRERAKEISAYDGQLWERDSIGSSFAEVFDVGVGTMLKQRQLDCFKFGYGQISGVVPFLIAAPKYFAGAFKMGELMQTVSAFNGVRSSLSWFIYNYVSLSELKAAIDRLIQFDAVLQKADSGSNFLTGEGTNNDLSVKNLEVLLPDGQLLANKISFELPSGTKTALTGPSGIGKSTLLYVLRNMWPFGRGEILLPKGTKLFFSQYPYLPVGSICEALAYPQQNLAGDIESCQEILKAVELEHLLPVLDKRQNWETVLSPGEQQRLSLGRIWLQKPSWVFLDEALSAVDPVQKERILQRLRRDHPELSVLGIEHYGEESSFYDNILTWNEWSDRDKERL